MEKIKVIADRCAEYSLYILLFFIPISKAAIEIFFTLALLAFLIKKALEPDFRFLKNPAHFFLLLFCGFCALSLFNSGTSIHTSLVALFFKWLEYIAIFIIAEDTLNTPGRLRNAIAILLMAGGLVGLDGVFQKFTGVDFLRQRSLVGGRVTAAFKNPNDFSAYLTPILLLIISVLFSRHLKRHHKRILFSLWNLLVVCLILTSSRGAWLGLFIGLFLLTFLSKKFKALIPLIFVLAVIFISIPVLRMRIEHSFLPGGDSERIPLAHTAWEMIKENPFLGKGLGASEQSAHNNYLQIWVEAGVFSLLSFLAFLGVLLSRAIKAFKEDDDFFVLGFLCGIFVFLVHSFFDTQLYSLQLAVLFWSMCGILSALINPLARIPGLSPVDE